MKIFLSASYEDAPYLATFAPLCRHRNATSVKFKTDAPSMYNEFIQWCKIYDADAVVITNVITLEFVLNAQADYRPPNTRKGITLNDYQGSLLYVHVGDRTIPCVVLNPLEHLVKVPYGKFVAQRFLSKILEPEKWMPDIPFIWKLVELKDAEAVVGMLSRARLISVDIETPVSGEWAELRGINCVGYSGLFTGKDGRVRIESYVLPFEEWSYNFIRRINDTPVPKVTQNGLYDNSYFLRWGIPLRSWYWDTYHFFHSWLSELPRDLGFISAFSVRSIRYWKDDGKSGSLEDYYRYNARDAWGTLSSLLGLLHDSPDWAITNYVEHEFPVVFPCITCEMEGVRVDEEAFEKVFEAKKKKQEEDLTTIRTMVASPNFNPNSPQQVLNVFKILGCGALGSTDKAATLKARALHPLNDVVIGAIKEWKENAKIVSNYLVDTKLWNAGAGARLFYKLDPGGTDTGRLASRASNFWCGFQIQNIPRDSSELSVKHCIIADPGWLLGEGDYAQSEARCVGYLSGETALIELVESEHDYHAWNASRFFGVPYESIYDEKTGKTVNKPLRDLSKRTNHGANYNMGEGVMLDTMGPKYVSEAKRLLRLPAKLPLRKVCGHLLSIYEKTYPRVKKDWYASIVNTIKVSGMLVSPLGWTRKFFGQPDKNKVHLNAAVAHSPQNLSVGIINKAFYGIWRDQIYGDLRGRIRIKAQIHDSILFQYRVEHPEVPSIVQTRMRRETRVTDCFGIERVMVIPPDMSAGKKRWSELK